MPDNKPTDNEIKKALEYCAEAHKVGFCFSDCLRINLANTHLECKAELMKDAIDLINRKDEEVNRLQAENEFKQSTIDLMDNELQSYRLNNKKLRAENEQLAKDKENLAYSLANAVGKKMTAKAEAYKECIEKAKNDNDYYSTDGADVRAVFDDLLDNLLNKKYCEPCRIIVNRQSKRKHMHNKRHPKKILDLPINKVIAMLEAYNRKHKTLYSYGQFINLILQNLIKLEG